MKNRIKISIVTYKNTLQSIYNLLTELKDYSVCVVDNSPTDELRKELSCFCNIEYIFNNKNLGYGKGHNIAIKESIKNGTDYHLVLNPDIEFEIDVLSELVDFMDKHIEIGLSMPNIVYPNNKRQYLCKLLPTSWNLFARRFRIFKYWNKKTNIRFELRNADYSVPFSAPSLSGCFMFMRTNVLKKVGGFDERFFMYCEDIDLSRRMYQVASNMFVPTKPVIHRHNKASYRTNKLFFIHIRSAIQYFNKWGWFFDKERKKINLDTLRKLDLS